MSYSKRSTARRVAHHRTSSALCVLVFDNFKRKSSASTGPADIRATLFGDLQLSQWPPEQSDSSSSEPWKTFFLARQAIAEGRVPDAIAGWRHVIGLPNLESRHYAQAWFFLRQYGIRPAVESATYLLGVIMEIPVTGGLDLLAAYRDHTARYLNYGGAGVIWEHPDKSLDPYIDALLNAGDLIVRVIGVGDKPRPPAPPPGQARLNFLTPGGLSFGQGPFAALAKDRLAKSVIDAGTLLMQKLIASGGRPDT